MYKSSWIILVLSTSYLTGFGQTTTLEEYNYVSKGYKVQLESGLDMKKGYQFKDILSLPVFTGNNIKRICSFKGLYKDNDSIPSAILCIYTRSDNGYKAYLCIPTIDASKELWDQTFKEFSEYLTNVDATATILFSFMKLSAHLSAKKANL